MIEHTPSRRRTRQIAAPATPAPEAPKHSFLSTERKQPSSTALATTSMEEAFTVMATAKAEQLRQEIFEQGQRIAEQFVQIHLEALEEGLQL